jgi:hypothetical protein
MKHHELREPHLALHVEQLEIELDMTGDSMVVAAFRRWRRAVRERSGIHLGLNEHRRHP